MVAIAGLLGSGRSETLLALFGALPRGGRRDRRPPDPAGRIEAAIDAGMAWSPRIARAPGWCSISRRAQHQPGEPRPGLLGGAGRSTARTEVAERLAGSWPPAAPHRPAGARVQRRQPAEDRAWQVAGPPPRHPAAGRADARRRRRRQGRDLRHHRPAERAGPPSSWSRRTCSRSSASPTGSSCCMKAHRKASCPAAARPRSRS